MEKNKMIHSSEKVENGIHRQARSLVRYGGEGLLHPLLQSIQRVCKSVQGLGHWYPRLYPEGILRGYARVCKVVLRGYARVCKVVLRGYTRVCKSMQEYARICKAVFGGYAYHKTSQQQSCSVRSTFAGGISLAC